jgi:hypothetical protein
MYVTHIFSPYKVVHDCWLTIYETPNLWHLLSQVHAYISIYGNVFFADENGLGKAVRKNGVKMSFIQRARAAAPTHLKCYRRHLHQSRGRLGAWVSRGNRPQKETLGSVSMYPLVLVTRLAAVTVCRPLPRSPLFDDVPMTSTYVRVFWTLVSPPDDAL